MPELINQISLTADAANAAAGAAAEYQGVPGLTYYAYWVITHYPIGDSISGPLEVYKAAATLSASNYVVISWQPAIGATGYDVCRTATPAAPQSGTSVLVQGSIPANTSSITDQGSALQTYTGHVRTAPATCVIYVNNRDQAQPALVIPTSILEVNTIRFADGSSQSSGAQQTQTPWGQNINAAGYNLVSVGIIGIGTVAPGSNPLQIAKDSNIESLGMGGAQIQITGVTNPNLRLSIGIDTTNNIGVIQSGTTGTGYNPTTINPFGGNVGIGTASPNAKFNLNNGMAVDPSLTPVANEAFTIRGSQVELSVGLALSGVSPAFIQARNAGAAWYLVLNPLGGNVGIGTASPQVLLDLPTFNASNSNFRSGSLEIQAFALGHDTISDNLYYNGTGWVYRNAGYGVLVSIASGALSVQLAPSGAAGAGATVTQAFVINANGNVGVGSSTSTMSLSGNVAMPNLPSVAPAAGSKQLWYDPADSNRVKYVP